MSASTQHGPTTPSTPRRRRRGPGWVPEQHGAWAMLAAPLAVGVLRGGPRPLHLLLAVAWFVAYFSFSATGLWLKSRRRAKYWPPVRAYGVALAVVGAALLALDPGLLRWAPTYGPLLAVGLWCSATRRERSLLNDGATVLAACLMVVVAWQLESSAFDAPPMAWAWAGVLFAYFFGTALYVKTMIRERGNRAMLRASIGYHAGWTLVLVTLALVARTGSGAVLGVGPSTWWALAAFFAILTARAAAVPRWRPRATPKQLGLGEIIATVALVTLLLAA